jgi:xanthine dehydrogenase YagS FAD-binding subunit
MIPSFSYVRPRQLEAVFTHLKSGSALVHAGGTDLLGCMREGILTPDTLVSVSALKDLEGISEREGGGVRVGALTTITDVAESDLLRERFTALAKGASEVASPQLRNQGTIGGNLCQKPRCWYYRGEFDCLRKGGGTCFAVTGQNQFHCVLGGSGCYIVHPSDTAPALIALGAEARLVSKEGARRVPVAELFVPPDEDLTRETVLEPHELLTEILIPAPPAGLKSSYRKVRARRSWDFALAGVALGLVLEGGTVKHARVVLSGAAPVPWRAEAAEQALVGHTLDPGRAASAAQQALKGAEPLEHNQYKIPLLKAVIEQELLKHTQG